MILLKNCYCIKTEKDRENFFDMDILIEEGRIAEIGKNIHIPKDKQHSLRTIDASRHTVLPGLVNTHHHFYQTLTRNLPAIQNAKLFDWLVYLYEIWKHLDEDAVYWSTALATAELLKTGCTTTTDHHYLYPDTVSGDIMGIQFEGAADTGIRFCPTRGSMSRSKKDGGLPPDSVVQTEDDILKDSRRVIEKFHNPSELSMQKIMLAPCSPFSVSENLMKQSAELARKYGVRIHTHLAETRDEEEYCIEVYGRRPMKVMEDTGFLGKDVSFAHGIFLGDKELQVLADTGTHIAHCPSSNMRLGSGICRVKEMLKQGINVALAVDGSASNDSSDMLGEIRNAMLLQRVAEGADGLTADSAFKMATENGARLLGYNKLGRIAEGWGADLALFNVFKPEYAGALQDPASALIFSGFNHGADYTIVNGKVVVENGTLKGINEEKLFTNAQAAADRLYRKAGI